MFPNTEQVTPTLVATVCMLLTAPPSDSGTLVEAVLSEVDVGRNTVMAALRRLHAAGWVTRTRRCVTERYRWEMTRAGRVEAAKMLNRQLPMVRKVVTCQGCDSVLRAGHNGYRRPSGELRCINCDVVDDADRCRAGHRYVTETTLILPGDVRQCLICYPWAVRRPPK